MTQHDVTAYATLADAVREHAAGHARTVRYTDEQWTAIKALHDAFGLDVTECSAIAFLAGQPLLAVRVDDVRPALTTKRTWHVLEAWDDVPEPELQMPDLPDGIRALIDQTTNHSTASSTDPEKE
ncbi:hypothetical protein GCM10023340_38890 [Nocardioides marinquilinus]|uniref:Uncharacterized protein n=1 Tax=Nocardioides marinquilinus TaxID=1210400 RepID=A0ABP9PZD2_9ACTN